MECKHRNSYFIMNHLSPLSNFPSKFCYSCTLSYRKRWTISSVNMKISKGMINMPKPSVEHYICTKNCLTSKKWSLTTKKVKLNLLVPVIDVILWKSTQDSLNLRPIEVLTNLTKDHLFFQFASLGIFSLLRTGLRCKSSPVNCLLDMLK